MKQITIKELKKQLKESYGIRYKDADKAVDLIVDVIRELQDKSNVDRIENIVPTRLVAILEECSDDLRKACKYLGYEIFGI